MNLKDRLGPLIGGIQAVTDKIGRLYKRADARSGGRLTIVGDAVGRFSEVRAGESAAAMAYTAFFSLFPLLLSLIAAAGFVLESNQAAYKRVIGAIIGAFPGSRALIRQNIQQVLELRGTVGLIGLATLLVSARGVFGLLASNINRAWPDSERRGSLRMQLLALGMEGMLLIFLGLWLGSTAVLKLVPDLRDIPGISAEILETPFWSVVSNIVPWLLANTLFFALYRWSPNVDVRWSVAAWGAVVTATAWHSATTAFAWYLSSGLVQYQLVYGSLGTVAALLIWIYYSSLITLFGAHLTAAIVRHAKTAEANDA